jgi:Spy/CpxP family protein refolding chaperone
MLSRSKVWAAALLLAVFAAGATVGAAVITAWNPLKPSVSRSGGRGDHDRGRRPSYAERLQLELNLTTEQRAAVDAILEEREAEMRELWAQMKPQYDALRETVRTEIMEVLDPEQQERFRALIERSRSRGERERGETDRN